MKKILCFLSAPKDKYLSLALLVIRLLVGVTMLTHGVAKFQAFAALEPTFYDPIGLGAQISLVMIISAEIACSLLLILGLFTRLAVLPLIFSMGVIVFVVHMGQGFAAQELPLLYLGVYMVLLFTGAGRYSLDAVILHKIQNCQCKGSSCCKS